MKISIVTISYNQAQFLRQCIDSVLSQEGVDLEYIVVDPGSTDGSRELIESYGEQIVRVFEPDDGPADGLNKGFAKATGDIFGFLNSDDYFLPGSLVIVDKYFMREGLDTFVTGIGYIEHENKPKQRVFPTKLSLYKYLIGASNVFQQGTFFPSYMFYKIGGFNRANKSCWDGELFAEFLYAGYKHCVIPHELAVFRLYSDSITGSGRLKKQYDADNLRIFNAFLGREPNLFDYFMNLVLRLIKKSQQYKSY